MNRLFLRDFLTGVTALVGLIGLIVMLILFGELAPLAERTYSFSLRVANANGLDETSPVLLDGVRVGQVMSAEAGGTQGAGTPGAVLVLRLRRGVDIPRASKITVDRGFVGGSSLEFITIDLPAEVRRDVVKAGEVVDGGNPETLLGSIKELVEGPMSQFSSTAERIDELAREYTELGRRLNELVEPRTLADVDSGKPANLRTTLARLDAALVGAQAWLGDETSRRRFQDLLARAGTVMDDAQGLVGEWTQAARDVRMQAERVGTQVGELSQRAQGLADDAQRTLAQTQEAAQELATLMSGINEGQGTLGQLATNPDLYRSLEDAAARLDRALEEAQQVIEKLKAEGIRLRL